MKHVCTICRQNGHNARTCRNSPVQKIPEKAEITLPKNWNDAFAAWIARKCQHLSQTQLATQLKTSPPSLVGWRNGTLPSAETRAQVEAMSGGDVPAHLPRRQPCLKRGRKPTHSRDEQLLAIIDRHAQALTASIARIRAMVAANGNGVGQ